MSNKTNPSSRNITIIVLIVGLIFVAVGAGFSYVSYQFTRTAVTTTGVVTDVRSFKRRQGDLETFYIPTISFVDEQGAPQSAETPSSSDKYNFSIGTEIGIRYDPDNPSDIKLDKWFDLWGYGALFIMIGFGIFAYVIYAVQHWKKRGGLQRDPDASA